MRRYWCSWIEATKHDSPEEPGYVELVFGGDTGIREAWATDWLMGGNAAVVRAVVDANSEREVKRIVEKNYSPMQWGPVVERALDWWPTDSEP